MQQTTGTRRDQKIYHYNFQFQKHLENTHLGKDLTRCSYTPFLMANGGHLRTYLFKVLFFICSNIFRLFELWHSFKWAYWPHSFNHSPNICWAPTNRSTVLGTGIDCWIRQGPWCYEVFTPESYLLFQLANFKHPVYFVSVENTQCSQVVLHSVRFAAGVKIFLLQGIPLFFLATECIVLNESKNKQWKFGTFRRVIYCSKLC